LTLGIPEAAKIFKIFTTTTSTSRELILTVLRWMDATDSSRKLPSVPSEYFCTYSKRHILLKGPTIYSTFKSTLISTYKINTSERSSVSFSRIGGCRRNQIGPLKSSSTNQSMSTKIFRLLNVGQKFMSLLKKTRKRAKKQRSDKKTKFNFKIKMCKIS
jgi:hypothetical protein